MEARVERRERRWRSGGKRCRRKRRDGGGRDDGGRRSTRKRGGRTECSDYHENPVESVAPRGRKTGPVDKNHSRCVTYRFECDGRRSPPILIRSLFPPSARPRPPFHPPGRLDLSAFLVPLSRTQYTKPPPPHCRRPDPRELPPLSILASANVQFLPRCLVLPRRRFPVCV